MHALYYTHCNIALSAFGWGPARPTLSPPSPTPAGLFGRVDHLMRGEEARPMVVPPLAASARVAAQLNALRLRYLAVLVGFNGAQWWRRACPFAPTAKRGTATAASRLARARRTGAVRKGRSRASRGYAGDLRSPTGWPAAPPGPRPGGIPQNMSHRRTCGTTRVNPPAGLRVYVPTV